MTILIRASSPDDGVMPHKIKESMQKSGYTPVASTLALAGLKKKNLVDFFDEPDRQSAAYVLEID
jgi:hypothetical protein